MITIPTPITGEQLVLCYTCILLYIILLYYFNSLIWLTASRVVKNYSMNFNDIVPFFACFQLECQINK